MLFNATPVGTDFTNTGTNTFAYVVTNGPVGGISVAAPSPLRATSSRLPSSIAWLPSSTTGSLTFQYLNPTTSSGPLAAGAMSGTIVVISTQPFTQQYVSVQNPEPQTLYPKAYSPTGGTIDQVPAPEPATVLAWAGVIACLAIGRRFRRRQQPPDASCKHPHRTAFRRRSLHAAGPRSYDTLAPRHLLEGREGLCRFQAIWFRICTVRKAGRPDRHDSTHSDD